MSRMKKLKTYRLRFLIMLAVLAVVAVGYFTAGGIGNFCGIGFESITLLCPLGALLAMIAERTAIPMAVISVVVVLLVCIVLGKVFCAWVCPVHFMSRGKRKGKRGSGSVPAPSHAAADDFAGSPVSHAAQAGEPAAQAAAPAPALCTPCSTCASPCGKSKGIKIDSRHGILAAALGSTLIFGFPVFCLVCPIGLVFATMLAVGYAFSQHIFVWDMVVFPLILALELVVFKSWCFKICPVSAFLSLLSRRRRFVRPRVDESACLRANGIDCHACVDLCPENVDPHSLDIPECTQCGLCADACPEKAIRLAKRP